MLRIMRWCWFAAHNDHRDGAILALDLGLVLVLVDRQGLVVPELVLMPPYRLPTVTIRIDLSLVGHDTNACARLLTNEVVQYRPQHRLESRRDDIERDLIVEAEIVEGFEVLIHAQLLLEHLKAILERHVK